MMPILKSNLISINRREGAVVGLITGIVGAGGGFDKFLP